jgi:hypothetical protein
MLAPLQVNSGMKTIQLTQGQVAAVDDDLFEELNKHKWYAAREGKTFYAQRGVGPRASRKTLSMHREVFRLRGELIPITVDHVDRDGVNNVRSNLRAATKGEQAFNRGRQNNNSSGFIGVSWASRESKWRATISLKGARYSLGYFHAPQDAAKAYNRAATELHGEYAVLNVLEDE